MSEINKPHLSPERPTLKQVEHFFATTPEERIYEIFAEADKKSEKVRNQPHYEKKLTDDILKRPFNV